MLRSLHVKNFAIIDDMTVNFMTGLNIITGETGAGKSILVSALTSLLGARFSRDNIRTGAGSTVVEGEFTNGDKIDIIRRIYYSNGKSRSFLNDIPISVEKLRQKTEFLVDVHGQHDHQRLLNAENHLEYLDAFGNYQRELEILANLYSGIVNLKQEIDLQTRQLEKLAEQKELYEFQLAELTEIPLTNDLDLKLSEEYKILANAEELRRGLTNLINLLDESPGSLKEVVAQSIREISGLPETDKQIRTIAERLDSLQLETDDIVADLIQIRQGIVADDARLDQLSDQLQHVEKLKRKYGGSLEEAIAYREEIETQLSRSDSGASQLKALQNDLNRAREKYFKLAEKISRMRKKNASRLEQKILSVLDRMDMPDTQLKILLGQLEAGSMLPTGLDTCEFYISANVGEKIRPLTRIASGGEISRFMLAIKMVLHDRDSVDTLIFDEIDSGISGRTALKIGEILEELGGCKQVLCITHLPQIASRGRTHFKIFKEQKNNRTVSKFQKLKRDERIKEIASLLSGEVVTTSGLEQATRLLEGKILIDG
ncbi:MAG: DNA repair protein RecN [FCB group bacterium]|nr:DNA repair protein RecN [FCB group bacterium]